MSKNLVLIYNNINKKLHFNRNKLIGGINRQGFIIPPNGVILKNGNLAGYYQEGGYKKWIEVGKIITKSKKGIPTYKDLRKINHKNNSLDNSIKKLRNYYIQELN